MQIDRVSGGNIPVAFKNRNSFVSKPVYFTGQKLKNDTFEMNSLNVDFKTESLSPKKFDAILSERVKNVSVSNRAELISQLTEVLDKYLQGEWDYEKNPQKYNSTVKALKKLMGKRGSGNIVMAQTDPIPGNIEANTTKAVKYIKTAEKIGADAVIFPEMSLMGYPIHDAIDRHPIIVEENIRWLKELAKQTGKTRAIVGFVEPNLSRTEGKAFYNSVAVLGDGKILGITRKTLLPTYGEFNDSRYMESSPFIGTQPAQTLGNFNGAQTPDKLIDIHGHKYGIVICEDGWNNKEFFNSKALYHVDPVAELAKENPDAIINCSASPSRTDKEALKNNLLSYTAKTHEIPMVYVNQVGALDDCSFDGASRVYNSSGELTTRAKSFKEQFMITNPFEKETGKIYPLAKGLEKIKAPQTKFSLDYESDMGRIYETLVQGVRDYFKKNGLKRAVLGLSGGLDSTVNAVILADALGPENVYGFSLPSKITSRESRTDAQILAQNLGINFDEIPIKGMVNSINDVLNPVLDRMENNWNCRYKHSFLQDNNQARSRATLLWGISNSFDRAIPIATSDKSELYMGYATINGDMSGGFAPIADVTKTKLFALANWMNKNREQKDAIPEAIIAKPPGAELAIDPKTGKPLVAEDALMPYEFMDEVIWRLENKNETIKDMLQSEFVYEENHPVSLEQEAFETLYNFIKGGPGSFVTDTFNTRHATEKYILPLAKRAQKENKELGLNTVINARPDSGDPFEEIKYVLDLAVNNGMYRTIKTRDGKILKGMTVLKALEADGMNFKKMIDLNNRLIEAGYSPSDCISYGVGGSLHDLISRSNMSAAQKLAEVGSGANTRQVMKMAEGKESIPGEIKVVREEGSKAPTVRRLNEDGKDAYVTWFDGIDGHGIEYNEKFENVQKRVLNDFNKYQKPENIFSEGVETLKAEIKSHHKNNN